MVKHYGKQGDGIMKPESIIELDSPVMSTELFL